MEIITTHLEGVMVITPEIFSDERGFFMETWNKEKFLDIGIQADFIQDNHSHSTQGTLRGLHYQIQHAQGKLVRALSGEIFDAAVDLRKSSSTFGQWFGEYLSGENKKMLWIPPGFAHGFYVTSFTADVIYKCTDYYAPKYERCIAWDDTDIALNWPIPAGTAPLLSDKDLRGYPISESEIYP